MGKNMYDCKGFFKKYKTIKTPDEFKKLMHNAISHISTPRDREHALSVLGECIISYEHQHLHQLPRQDRTTRIMDISRMVRTVCIT